MRPEPVAFMRGNWELRGMPTFGKSLTGSEVVGSDGTTIGRYNDVEYNARTGNIEYLLVNPEENTPVARVRFEQSEGQFKVPIDAVKASKDRILVEH